MLSTAAMTSSSRFEPPGWMIAAHAGLERGLRRRRRTGRTRRRPARRRAAGLAAPSRPRACTASTRLIWPAPMPTVARSRAITIAFERTCLHDAPGEQQVAPLALGRRRARRRPPSCRDPRTRCRDPGSAGRRARGGSRARPASARAARRTRGRRSLAARRSRSTRALVVAGREQHLHELGSPALGELAADRPVDARRRRRTPSVGIGRQARLRYASSSVAPTRARRRGWRA